ncbi:hypothetical protein RJ639_031039 [Escallonia herrerae]|uniref:F-box domain-containing protein n=1 Tax=Escallonia herrerae TaxID=1293975 RepID=A0AA88WZI3_9ASTE|nr:hypothetical protein RJ639_031039 [Escallonia herrerae]
MAKVSPKERQSKASKQKRRARTSSNKYLKPGALAQLRNSKASAIKSCTDLGKKRVAVLDSTKRDSDVLLSSNEIEENPALLSPVRFGYGAAVGPLDVVKLNNLQRTPKTPRAEPYESESRLEALPIDLLVNTLCHLHHDQLRAVFHVSRKIRTAVVLARQFYFNYTTPDRSRQEILKTITPLPTEHWPFVSKGDGKGLRMPSPSTPKAPKHGPRPPSRMKVTDMRQIAAVLFQESAFPSRCMMPSLPKPIFKSLASNRVLFYEDELCKAVAQNKLR